MLRVVGQCDDNGTRIENRLGEPAANPYLYIASQIHAGLDGITRRLEAPPPTDAPYGGSAEKIPSSLGEALEALKADATLAAGMGDTFIDCFTHIKQAEISRHDGAEDKDDWQRREYFSRI